ncbi:hypothetical protein AVEN_185727-1 [Araneus ventricosus]|uniref:Uncharacterized protein n=1 Tax=Araneus ventricosus TaxID=182803 RepID=A0A4Y2I1W9_ARAVE|nr:hypothetical protein AVEN_185727-1 [Araneus ventricosus]
MRPMTGGGSRRKGTLPPDAMRFSEDLAQVSNPESSQTDGRAGNGSHDFCILIQYSAFCILLYASFITKETKPQAGLRAEITNSKHGASAILQTDHATLVRSVHSSKKKAWIGIPICSC